MIQPEGGGKYQKATWQKRTKLRNSGCRAHPLRSVRRGQHLFGTLYLTIEKTKKFYLQ
jgi:hypothetical protein